VGQERADDGIFSRSDFTFDVTANAYTCPGGKLLQKYRRPFAKPRIGVTKDNTLIYKASQHDCAACNFKTKCCSGQPRRKIARSIHEAARDLVRNLRNMPAYLQSRRERKKLEMLFAHLKRILKLNRLRLRGPFGAQDGFLLAVIAQNLRKLAKVAPGQAINKLFACQYRTGRRTG
jgi:Transposase DDE domain